jgi:hypothetical protein
MIKIRNEISEIDTTEAIEKMNYAVAFLMK